MRDAEIDGKKLTLNNKENREEFQRADCSRREK